MDAAIHAILYYVEVLAVHQEQPAAVAAHAILVLLTVLAIAILLRVEVLAVHQEQLLAVVVYAILVLPRATAPPTLFLVEGLAVDREQLVAMVVYATPVLLLAVPALPTLFHVEVLVVHREQSAAVVVIVILRVHRPCRFTTHLHFQPYVRPLCQLKARPNLQVLTLQFAHLYFQLRVRPSYPHCRLSARLGLQPLIPPIARLDFQPIIHRRCQLQPRPKFRHRILRRCRL